MEQEKLDEMDAIAKGALLDFGDFTEEEVEEWCKIRLKIKVKLKEGK